MLESKNKVDALLVFRGFACFNVVLSHVIGDFSPNTMLVPFFGHDFTWVIRVTGPLGVWMFFVLSGYLMGKGYYTKRYVLTIRSSANFYYNRFLRIYPLYVASIIIVWAIYIRSFPVNAVNLWTLLHLLLFSYHVDSPFPNAVLWTISTEFRFYLLVPFVFVLTSRLIKDTRGYILCMTLILLTGLLYRGHVYVKYFDHVGFFYQWLFKCYIPLRGNLDMFLSGFLLNFLVQKRREIGSISSASLRTKKMIALGVFGFAILIYSRFSDEALLFSAPIYSPGFFIGAQTMIILAACFLIYHFESKNNYHIVAIKWQTITENPFRTLEIFGILTYGTYIWHMPIMESFSLWHVELHNNDELLMVKFLYTFLLATLASSVTYYLIEKRIPAFRLKRV